MDAWTIDRNGKDNGRSGFGGKTKKGLFWPCQVGEAMRYPVEMLEMSPEFWVEIGLARHKSKLIGHGCGSALSCTNSSH